MAQKPADRPAGVTFLIGVVLIFTSLNALRVITALQTRSLLSSLPLDVPLPYFIITGTAWSILGLVLVVGLFTRRRRALLLAVILTLAYPVYYWFDRLFIAESALVESRWQFAFGLTFLLLVPALWILRQPATGSYLNK
jgi:hypothetical protein